MKKLVSFLLVMILAFSSVLTITTNAAVGDVVGQAVHTDIVAYINHYAIPSYAANGRSCIVAEDLRNFGFDVIWDGAARTLSIYRNANTAVSEMTVDKSEASGNFFSNILATDIKVYANGQQLTSYALNGYTMIPIEELTMFGAVYWVPEERAIKLWVDGLNQRETKQQPTIVPKVVFSANIGEVEGVIYSTRNIKEGKNGAYITSEQVGGMVRNINTCKMLPITVEAGKFVGGFCYYNGYIYYSVSTEGEYGWRAWIYRCKPDGSESKMLWADGGREFIISHGVLYTQMAMSQFEGIAINLSDLSVTYADYPDNICGSGVTAVIYNDMFFFNDGGELYKEINGEYVYLASNVDYLDGGFTSQYLYYTVSDQGQTRLYRVPLNGGVKEFVDAVDGGGNFGYFFW